ncbi:MAG: AsmA family protein, partial [Proteobacteria bacterium]|nr:AsmA family protein [Pseudomonadota bacterium]
MRAVFLILGVLVFAVIAVGAAALFAIQSIDLARYQGLVADRVLSATGRALAIDGEVRVAGLLRPAIAVSGVRFANTPGAADPDMVRIAEIEAKLRLWPLLFGKVLLDRLVVRGARILLETDASGGANWQFTPADDADDDGGISIPAAIGEIEITDSTLEYRAAGADPVLLGINSATLGAASANAQVTLAAALTWDGAPVAITARSASAVALARSFPNLPLTFSVSAFGATLAADGRIAAGTAEFVVTAAADRLGAIKEK